MSRMQELNALEEAEAEQISGQSITSLGDVTTPRARLLGALAWVHRKRTEPELKYGEFMKSLRTADVLAYLYGDDDETDDGDDAETAHGAGGEAAEDDEPPAGGLEPFPAEDGGGAGAVGRVADAEGPVLSGDGDQSV